MLEITHLNPCHISSFALPCPFVRFELIKLSSVFLSLFLFAPPICHVHEVAYIVLEGVHHQILIQSHLAI